MEIILNKKPKRPTIITGFPGFGLVGTITTEYLIDHLDAKLIGEIKIEENPPMIAIHKGEIVEPLGIFYNSKYNIIILHALTAVNGMEWKLANAIVQLNKLVNAKEIISLEGVGSQEIDSDKEPSSYYFSKCSAKRLEKTGISPLSEGIVMGVTGALLLNKKCNVSAIFAETHSALPDSRAAAKVIEVLDKYLGLKVNYAPLLKKAEGFEAKLKDLLQKGQTAHKVKQEKELSYLG